MINSIKVCGYLSGFCSQPCWAVSPKFCRQLSEEIAFKFPPFLSKEWYSQIKYKIQVLLRIDDHWPVRAHTYVLCRGSWRQTYSPHLSVDYTTYHLFWINNRGNNTVNQERLNTQNNATCSVALFVGVRFHLAEIHMADSTGIAHLWNFSFWLSPERLWVSNLDPEYYWSPPLLE